MTPDEQDLFHLQAETLFHSLIRPVASSLLYGISVALFIYVTYLFWKKRMSGRSAQTMASAAILCFLLTTANFAASAITITNQFKTLSIPAVSNPGEEIINIPTRAYDIYFLTQYCILAISDFIVVWRTQALYPDRPTLYRIPSLLLVGSIVCLIGAFAIERRHPGWPIKRNDSLHQTVDVIGQTLSLATNIVTTILVGARIWSYRTWFVKHTGATGGNSFKQIQHKLLILFETGALFCIVQLVAVGYTITVNFRTQRGLPCRGMCIYALYAVSRFRYVFAANYSIIVLALVHGKTSLTSMTYLECMTRNANDDGESEQSGNEATEMFPITKSGYNDSSSPSGARLLYLDRG